MTKQEFISQLAHRLRILPEGERADALDYYSGYISDAESEEAAIAQLGSPGEVAAMILADFVEKIPPHGETPTIEPMRASGVKSAWMLILAMFALPIGLPLVISIGAVAFALFIALAAVVFSFGVSGIAALAGGLATLVSSFIIITQDIGFAALAAGMGLAGIGIGIWLVRLAYYTMGGFAWIARFVGKKIKNRSERHGYKAIQ